MAWASQKGGVRYSCLLQQTSGMHDRTRDLRQSVLGGTLSYPTPAVGATGASTGD